MKPPGDAFAAPPAPTSATAANPNPITAWSSRRLSIVTPSINGNSASQPLPVCGRAGDDHARFLRLQIGFRRRRLRPGARSRGRDIRA
ncbi:hypothetical protein Pen01_56300 [Phytomonospora endophytica]|nr:hypothetical protein Pen01_56300 [Phytomonospora endophytica]